MGLDVVEGVTSCGGWLIDDACSIWVVEGAIGEFGDLRRGCCVAWGGSCCCVGIAMRLLFARSTIMASNSTIIVDSLMLSLPGDCDADLIVLPKIPFARVWTSRALAQLRRLMSC